MEHKKKHYNVGKNHPLYGKKHSKETIEKMSAAKIGKNNVFYGKKHSKETKKKMSKANKGSSNGMWSGDKINQCSVHAYIRQNNKIPKRCSKCKALTKNIDLANVTGVYDRNIKNYKWLCRSCHMKSDGRLERLKKANLKYMKNAMRNAKGQFVKKEA